MIDLLGRVSERTGATISTRTTIYLLRFDSRRPGRAKMSDDRISNRIRRLRFDHNEMTQQQLADKVGVTRQTILAIEAGKYAPSLPLAFRVARAFNASVEDVFQYPDGETPSEPSRS